MGSPRACQPSRSAIARRRRILRSPLLQDGHFIDGQCAENVSHFGHLSAEKIPGRHTSPPKADPGSGNPMYCCLMYGCQGHYFFARPLRQSHTPQPYVTHLHDNPQGGGHESCRVLSPWFFFHSRPPLGNPLLLPFTSFRRGRQICPPQAHRHYPGSV